MTLLSDLRRQVLNADLELLRLSLGCHTFVHASGIARDKGLVVSKPSGVCYEEIKPLHFAIVDLSGKVEVGQLCPSSDLPAHISLYQAFPRIGGIAHSRSEHATALAQARPIPCLGTDHVDFFHGPAPVTSVLEEAEVASAHEQSTEHCITHAFRQLDYAAVPVVLVSDGLFTCGAGLSAVAHNALMPETIDRMACSTPAINPKEPPIAQKLLYKHYLPKHGGKAYYGLPGRAA